MYRQDISWQRRFFTDREELSQKGNFKDKKAFFSKTI